jgi:BMFP domain-containing protein YqiC
MSREPADITTDILIRIREDIGSLRGDVGRQFDGIGQRLDHLEGLIRKQQRDTAGLLVMANSVAGDFAEQLAAMEERVAALEGRQG